MYHPSRLEILHLLHDKLGLVLETILSHSIVSLDGRINTTTTNTSSSTMKGY